MNRDEAIAIVTAEDGDDGTKAFEWERAFGLDGLIQLAEELALERAAATFCVRTLRGASSDPSGRVDSHGPPRPEGSGSREDHTTQVRQCLSGGGVEQFYAWCPTCKRVGQYQAHRGDAEAIAQRHQDIGGFERAGGA